MVEEFAMKDKRKAYELDNVIETRLMGQRLGLSTLVVFLSLIFWGSLLGPVGMVLCIPLTMTLKFACENNKGTQWIAVLLGPEAPTESIPPVSKKGLLCDLKKILRRIDRENCTWAVQAAVQNSACTI
jgi:hypothetical protein